MQEGGLFYAKPCTMLGGAALTAGIASAWNSVSSALDNITKQENQLARLPQTIGSATDSFLSLNKAASDTKTDAGAFISTYANIATATEKMGLSEKEAIEATQGLTSALALGGGSEQAVTNALYQMGQAFSSNRFAGDEFRSFMEAIGTQAPEVAKAFDTDVAGLREMSEQGKLTAEVVVKAFRKMAAANVDMLKKQGWTWGQVLTVMGNDWTAFLAKATQGGEWQRLTDWLAGTIIPAVREAENNFAEFWSTLADESKSAILIGILAAVGAAFTALAIPVLAATWPFLAIGAAVWLIYELFVEFKAWMDGKGGTIFDRLFGQFDEFEKRYPAIVKGLKELKSLFAGMGGVATEESRPSQTQIDDFLKNRNGGGKPEKGLVERFLEYNGNFNPLPGLEKFLNLFVGDANAGEMSSITGRPQSGVTANYTNSGNKEVNIFVQQPSEAAEITNRLDNPGTINDSIGGNIALGQGAI
ncbi:tape measure protein [Citrobacter amalonaticus]|nr:tape measure protein [Citrobacter amalonaticus]